MGRMSDGFLLNLYVGCVSVHSVCMITQDQVKQFIEPSSSQIGIPCIISVLPYNLHDHPYIDVHMPH